MTVARVPTPQRGLTSDVARKDLTPLPRPQSPLSRRGRGADRTNEIGDDDDAVLDGDDDDDDAALDSDDCAAAGSCAPTPTPGGGGGDDDASAYPSFIFVRDTWHVYMPWLHGVASLPFCVF